MAPLSAFIFLASLAIWVGSIVFFSWVATPNVYGAWPPQQAIRAMAPMARSYLTLGWICGLIALLSSLFMAPIDGIYVTGRIVLVAVMFLLALYLSFGLGSKVRQAQQTMAEAGDDEVPKEALKSFDEFHGTVSQLNGALLLLGFLVVFITAFYV